MKRPSARITVEWTEVTSKDLAILAVVTALVLLIVRAWSTGSSVFRFESPYWDLGLIPILTVLVAAALRGRGSDSFRRRFWLGFEIFGGVADALYVASCSRPAMWSLVSAL